MSKSPRSHSSAAFCSSSITARWRFVCMLFPSSSARFIVVSVRRFLMGQKSARTRKFVSAKEESPSSLAMLEQAEEDGGSLLQDNVERTSATDDGGLLLQDAVGRIADEGGCLEWVPASGPASDAHYVVLDGDLFEARFNAIRRRKRPRTGTSVARSFSGMSNHFVLLSGHGRVRGSDQRIYRPRPLRRPPRLLAGEERRRQHLAGVGSTRT